MSTPELVYSTDQENFNLDDIGEVIDSLASDNENLFGLSYWVGEKVHHTASEFFKGHVDSLIDYAQDQAHQVGGEHAEDFAKGIIDIARNELDQLIGDWADKHVPVDFWTVTNIRERQICEEDLKENQ